jgi:hypothetical protein
MRWLGERLAFRHCVFLFDFSQLALSAVVKSHPVFSVSFSQIDVSI